MNPRFAIGERVHVQQRYPAGHIRTPYYIRGKSGEIERICGRFGNPESLAFGGSGKPHQTLYRVRFRQSEVWPDYDGNDGDVVEIEIFEHWLDPA